MLYCGNLLIVAVASNMVQRNQDTVDSWREDSGYSLDEKKTSYTCWVAVSGNMNMDELTGVSMMVFEQSHASQQYHKGSNSCNQIRMGMTDITDSWDTKWS